MRNMLELNARSLLALPIAAVVLTGCTDLRAVKAVPKDGKAPAGLVYHLPAKILDIKLDFQFSGCALSPEGVPLLSYTLTPTVAEKLVADPDQAYVIDYPELDGLTKTTDLDIKLFDNATLKSVNLTQDDRTGKILLDVVKTGFNIASTVVTGGTLTAGAFTEEIRLKKEAEGCAPLARKLATLAKAKAALRDAQGHDDQLSEAKDEVEVAQAAVNAALAAVKAAKAEGDDDAKNTAETDLLKARATLKKAEAAVKALGKAQTADAAKAVAAAVAAVTRSVTTSWRPVRPLDNNDFIEEPITLPMDALNGIIDDTAFTSIFAIEAKAVVAVPKPSMTGNLADNGSGGIVYRQPLPAKVYICDMGKEDWCAKVTTSQAKPDKGGDKLVTINTAALRLDTMITMPQFGLLATMPLHNGAFANNSLALALTENGTVTSLGFKSASRAERAAAAAQDASAGALAQMTSLTKLIAERKTANRQEQLDNQDFVKKLAEAQRAAELAKAGVVDQSVAQTQAAEQKIKEIEAQIKLIDAQSRLDAAKAAAGIQP